MCGISDWVDYVHHFKNSQLKKQVGMPKSHMWVAGGSADTRVIYRFNTCDQCALLHVI